MIFIKYFCSPSGSNKWKIFRMFLVLYFVLLLFFLWLHFVDICCDLYLSNKPHTRWRGWAEIERDAVVGVFCAFVSSCRDLGSCDNKYCPIMFNRKILRKWPSINHRYLLLAPLMSITLMKFFSGFWKQIWKNSTKLLHFLLVEFDPKNYKQHQ